jgi:glycosyltransferase involved in cell wall biosynthesis
MPPSPTPKISAVIPIYGNVGDLDRLIAALNGQTLKPWEIIVVDSSPKPLDKNPTGENVKYIRNPNDAGLAGDYNLGLKENTGDYQLNLQQDCLPEDEGALERLFHHLGQPGRVAAVPMVTLPESYYQEYDFWGKVMMARWRGRVWQGISGKFDLIRKDVFLKIEGYDTKTFKYSGEDMDLCLRLMEQGEVFVAEDVAILHCHKQGKQGKKVRCRDLFTRNYQLAQGFGALLRRWGWRLRSNPYSGHGTHHIGKYLYPTVPFLLIWPIPVAAALLILTQFINVESWRIRNWKTPLLLVINPLLFAVDFTGSVVGLVTGKQSYSQNK